MMKDKKFKIEIGGITTWIKPMKYRILDKYYIKRICPICRKELEKEDNVYQLINNYKLFPNILIHNICVYKNITSTLDWGVTLGMLKENYEGAKILRKYIECWFPEREESYETWR